MIAIAEPTRFETDLTAVHEQFLAMLPTIENMAKWAFRRLDAESHEEAIQDVVANAWRAYWRLVRLGKRDVAYATPLARYAILQYHCGRREGQRAKRRDICSPLKFSKRQTVVVHLSSLDREDDDLVDGLIDDRRSPVPDQVAFRIDFAAWIITHPERHQRIILALAIGNRPHEVAQQLGCSCARISQLRHRFRASWEDFYGEPAVA